MGSAFFFLLEKARQQELFVLSSHSAFGRLPPLLSFPSSGTSPLFRFACIFHPLRYHFKLPPFQTRRFLETHSTSSVSKQLSISLWQFLRLALFLSCPCLSHLLQHIVVHSGFLDDDVHERCPLFVLDGGLTPSGMRDRAHAPQVSFCSQIQKCLTTTECHPKPEKLGRSCIFDKCSRLCRCRHASKHLPTTTTSSLPVVDALHHVLRRAHCTGAAVIYLVLCTAHRSLSSTLYTTS